MGFIHHTDEFLKEIAEEYRQAAKFPGKFKPNQRIAATHNVPISRVESWVKQARTRGILEPHTRKTCPYCRQQRDLPPRIGHHHRASMRRMRGNALQLEARCHALSLEASRQKRPDDAMRYQQAEYHYRAIARLFGATDESR